MKLSQEHQQSRQVGRLKVRFEIYLQFLYFYKKKRSMITKEKLIQVINKMPEKINIEDVIEELVFLSKIEQGLNDVESGRVYTDSIVAEKMEKWLK